jgi:hypothetical protein
VIRIVLLVGLLTQGIPARTNETGSVTGTLRTTDGKPAVGIRVAARAVQDAVAEEEGAALAGLVETDEKGHYRLEGIPSGRYTIAAGRVDLPTYYPGTLDLASSKILSIGPGSTTSGVDFTLADVSYAVAGVSAQPPGVTIPVKVTSEGGGKLPVFAGGHFIQVVLTSEANGRIVSSTSPTTSSIVLPFPFMPARYRATVENLPIGITLKAITYGSTNLTTDALTLSAADLPLSAGILALANTANQNIVFSTFAGGALGTATAISARSTQEISITLGPGSSVSSRRDGVHVRGRLPDSGVRTIYVSDIPGIVYSDGTFEVEGVPPGKHVVVSSFNDRSPLGAIVIVGNRDVENVQLDPVLLLPREAPPPEIETRPPGTTIPLAGLSGRIVSDATGQPMRGALSVIGDSLQVAYAVGNDGKFEIPKLLPGTYNLQVSIFDHFTLNQTVLIGETDSTVELRVRPAY